MPDPLVLELCAGKGPPVWIDHMLEELAASLVLIAGAPAVGCPPPLVVASQGVEASLVDTYSTMEGAQWAADSPTLSPVQEGQPGVMDAEACSTHPGVDLATLSRHICPTLANAEPTTLGDMTIEAMMDIANRIPSPQLSSTEKQLKCFIGKVKRKVKTPLVPKPP